MQTNKEQVDRFKEANIQAAKVLKRYKRNQSDVGKFKQKVVNENGRDKDKD